MTENNADDAREIDAAPTVSQPVHLPDQQPVAAAPAPVLVAEKTSHTRTILEIVGGVVAVGLIFVSGAAGFVLGHVTAKHDGRGDGDRMMLRIDRDGDSGPTLERGQEGQGGPRLQQGRPDFQGGQGLQGGPGLQGDEGRPGFPTGPDGMPAFPGTPGQDSAPVLPQQGSAPNAPQVAPSAPQG